MGCSTEIPLAAIEAARERIAGIALRTPLVPLAPEPTTPESTGATDPTGPTGGPGVWLKLENLQPIGSFKLRGAANALALAPPEELERGVVTASAGNMGQGVAWCARRRGVPCRVVVPDHAPHAKLDALERLGAQVVSVPFDRWWRTLEERRFPGLDGFFVHPVEDEAVICGNGTIGLELLEDLPDLDTLLVPYGGGGLVTGIASALRALRPACRVIACEVETAAPLSASLTAGRPVAVDHVPSFVDGIGGRSVLASMWPRVVRLVDGAHVVSLEAVAGAVRRLLLCQRIVAEGAGATPVAAALDGAGAGGQRVACVISGGNLDAEVLVGILAGETPGPPTRMA